MAIPTRNEFEKAAAQVAAILAGAWSFDAPSWADARSMDVHIWDDETERAARYTRAVWTAEAYILLFANANARFCRDKFLIACGLAVKTPSKRAHSKG